MNTLSKIAVTSITGVALAVSAVSPAYAWSPEGKIVKSVQNISAKGELKDANTAAGAVNAQPGDNLLYSITISNPAAAADKQHNDLAYVVLRDTLPEGVELLDSATQREITANLGTILPGKSITKQYMVKVTATTDGKLIENKACFDGDSVIKDNPKKGCDVATVKVNVPVVPPTVTPVKPTTTVLTPTPVAAVPTPAAAVTVLPETGPASAIAFACTAMIIGYLANMLRLRNRTVRV